MFHRAAAAYHGVRLLNMISGESLYYALLEMAAVNDGSLFRAAFANPGTEIDSCAYEELLNLAPEIVRLVEKYDYLASPEFETSCAGKSAALVAMRRKQETDGQKARKRKEVMLIALQELATSRTAYKLISRKKHELLGMIETYLVRYRAKA